MSRVLGHADDSPRSPKRAHSGARGFFSCSTRSAHGSPHSKSLDGHRRHTDANPTSEPLAPSAAPRTTARIQHAHDRPPASPRAFAQGPRGAPQPIQSLAPVASLADRPTSAPAPAHDLCWGPSAAPHVRARRRGGLGRGKHQCLAGTRTRRARGDAACAPPRFRLTSGRRVRGAGTGTEARTGRGPVQRQAAGTRGCSRTRETVRRSRSASVRVGLSTPCAECRPLTVNHCAESVRTGLLDMDDSPSKAQFVPPGERK